MWAGYQINKDISLVAGTACMVATSTAMRMSASRASISHASECCDSQNGSKNNFFHFLLSHF